MVLETCCCCVDQIFGAFFVASVEIAEGLSSLGFGITWDTALMAFMFSLAGICLMDAIIRHNTNSALANIIILIFGTCLVIASTIQYFLTKDKSNSINDHDKENITTARLLFLIFIPVNIYFLIYVYKIHDLFKTEKEKEQECTSIIF